MIEPVAAVAWLRAPPIPLPGVVPGLAVDPTMALAFVLLAAGVIASAIPNLPGPLSSLAGLGLYWWSSGYTRPGPALLIALVAIGIVALIVDGLAGPVAARAGGASTRTAVVAGVIGAVSLLFVGPIIALGLLVTTVFVLELDRADDWRGGLRTATITAAGIVASIGVQVLLTAAILVAVVLMHLGAMPAP